MEQALMAVCKDIRLGKILIQTNHDTGEPEVCVCFRQYYKSFISVATLKTQFYMSDLAGSSCPTLLSKQDLSCLFDLFFSTVLIIVQVRFLCCIDLISFLTVFSLHPPASLPSSAQRHQ